MSTCTLSCEIANEWPGEFYICRNYEVRVKIFLHGGDDQCYHCMTAWLSATVAPDVGQDDRQAEAEEPEKGKIKRKRADS
jgi:hypothetical protein